MRGGGLGTWLHIKVSSYSIQFINDQVVFVADVVLSIEKCRYHLGFVNMFHCT